MTTKEHSFSVIMAVYDNARELEDNLPVFLNQDYEPAHEVIVVDESSTDDTDDIIKLQRQNSPILYSTFLPKPNRDIIRRKLALTIGVKASKYEWIILTDIHNKPTSSEWLKELNEVMDNTNDVMIGYYRKKGTYLQTFQDVSQVGAIVKKAERKKADGHKGKHMKYMRGKYDFIVVRADKAHELLKFFEQKISFSSLLGLRLSVLFHSFN